MLSKDAAVKENSVLGSVPHRRLVDSMAGNAADCFSSNRRNPNSARLQGWTTSIRDALPLDLVPGLLILECSWRRSPVSHTE